MNRKGENSKFILMLLAGLVILLHSTIPHHHHFDSNSDLNSSNSCKSEKRGESSNEANRHCHALNNIFFTKAIAITFNANTASTPLLFVFTVFDLLRHFDRVLLTTFSIKDIVIQKQCFPTYLTYRGPPTFVYFLLT